jgi:Fe-S cluster assembly scaffold protein SufB
MKRITTLIQVMLLFIGCLSFAQTARLQVVHNSPDLAAQTVDVYVNGTIFINDFEFRTATAFTTVPAGVTLSIDVAPGNSTSSTESLYNLTTTLASGQTYIAIANGIVSATGYTNPGSFALSVFALGREAATNPAQTDVLVNHGSPDAPTVDVVETAVPAGTIVDDISFPNYDGYLELPNLDFTLDVRDATGTTTVASYLAPLQTLNLDGAAITVIASGFLNPATNSNGPAFGLWVATAAGGDLIPLPLAPEPTARLQVIHNSPDVAASVVDVYVNGVITLNDFAFRTATPFIDVPAGVALSIDVAPGTSTSSTQSLYNLTTTLADGGTYIAIANGIVSATGYTNPSSFALSVFDLGREAATNPAQTDVLVNHGSPDAPTVDVVETSVPAGTIVDDISFPNYDGYLELPNLDFTLDVRDATGTTTVASYLAPLQTLNLDGAAITVIASGFLDPTTNSNGPAFGLWVATAAGGNLIPLPLATDPTARVQVIHNSPDLAAAVVDVYLNDVIALNDFAFRTATPFIDIPAGVEISIDIAPGNSTSSAESLYNLTTTLADGETYIAIANGIVSTTGYTNPSSFGLSVFAQGREVASNPAQTDVLVNHGSPDAPTVDVVETSVPAGTIVNDISFPSFAGYLELPNLDFTLDVRDATGTTTVASYSAPLQTLNLDGAAITVIASGFLNPATNSNGPAFGLWVATAAGGNLIPLPSVPLSTADFTAENVKIYPNPTNSIINIDVPFSYEKSEVSIVDVNGRTVVKASSIENSINVSGLTEGVYMLLLQVDDTLINKKIVIAN